MRIVFTVGQKLFAADAGPVVEIARWRPPHPLPGVRPPLAGLTLLREAVLPVIDAGQALGVPEGDRRHYVIVQKGGHLTAVAVGDVLDLGEEGQIRNVQSLDGCRALVLPDGRVAVWLGDWSFLEE